MDDLIDLGFRLERTHVVVTGGSGYIGSATVSFIPPHSAPPVPPSLQHIPSSQHSPLTINPPPAGKSLPGGRSLRHRLRHQQAPTPRPTPPLQVPPSRHHLRRTTRPRLRSRPPRFRHRPVLRRPRIPRPQRPAPPCLPHGHARRPMAPDPPRQRRRHHVDRQMVDAPDQEHEPRHQQRQSDHRRQRERPFRRADESRLCEREERRPGRFAPKLEKRYPPRLPGRKSQRRRPRPRRYRTIQIRMPAEPQPILAGRSGHHLPRPARPAHGRGAEHSLPGQRGLEQPYHRPSSKRRQRETRQGVMAQGGVVLRESTQKAPGAG